MLIAGRVRLLMLSCSIVLSGCNCSLERRKLLPVAKPH